MSTKRKPSKLDPHTQSAVNVAKHQYFVVAEFSGNENPGLLVGTEVQKFSDPECRPSKYWEGMYWTCLVICPNTETRRICCDALQPRKTDKYFKKQQKLFPRVNS